MSEFSSCPDQPENVYEKARKISDEEMASINLHRHRFHGDWNYTIKPRGA